MSSAPPTDPTLQAVQSRTAGDRIIRGGAARGLAYITGTGATALAFALLLRHLGVDDFGRFSTVIALGTIAAGLSELGLQTLGQRWYVAADDERRPGVIADILGIRLVITPVLVLATVLFAVIAGYSTEMVAGTAIAGVGLGLVAISTALWLPLQIGLRFATVATLEFARQVTIAAAIVVLVVVGAGLLPFFFGYLAAGLAMLIPTAIVARRSLVAPRWQWRTWRPMLIEAWPLALSIALNTLYLRMLIVMSSLLTTQKETGLFAAASRITEVIVAVPLFIASAAFPLLAHAGDRDQERLAYAVRRIGEVALLIGALFCVILFVGAAPIIHIFAGHGYDQAVPVLRLQAFALLGGSLTQAWIYAIVAVRAERSLLVVNAIALASVVVLGAVLIPTVHAIGASAAAVTGETIMALAVATALTRSRPELRPSTGHLLRLVIAIGVGLLAALLPIPAIVAAIIAGAATLGVAWAIGAVPPEIARALRGSRSQPR
jgi:O-antigen/teichoic acid export membrane protein